MDRNEFIWVIMQSAVRYGAGLYQIEKENEQDFYMVFRIDGEDEKYFVGLCDIEKAIESILESYDNEAEFEKDLWYINKHQRIGELEDWMADIIFQIAAFGEIRF